MITGSQLLNGLNAGQQQAVSAPRSNLLVLAGAGTGKTRVLVHRLAWLLSVERCLPSSILAVTFSNQAAAQIRQRVEQLLQQRHPSIWIGTFHGLAHRLLRLHSIAADLPLEFQIIDADDQLQLLRRVIRVHNLDEKKWSARQAASYINAKKEAGLRPRHIIVPENDKAAVTWLAIYQNYQAICDRSGLVDFAELLLRAHELWLNHPTLLTQYQNRFNNILVDEFQDTNGQQYAWIRCLAAEQAKVVIVGDDDQSIYGWRGAQVENLQQFCQDFTEVATVRLEQNYRSTGHILQAANQLITHNHSRLGKNLWTDDGLGPPIKLYSALDELDEASFIISQLQEWQLQGNLLSDCAILYRNNAQSRVLEEALLRANLPYRIYGGMRFFERQEIKDALAYLRLIANRHDDAAFERIINTPARGIGERTLLLIRHSARERQQSLWQAAVHVLQQQIVSGRAAAAIQRFVELIGALAQDGTGLPLYQQTDQVIRHSGLWQLYEQQSGELAQGRLDNLRELVTATQQFVPETESESGMPLQDFLSHVVLDAGERSHQSSLPMVQLMTLHSAKGLEFPRVFIVGLEEGLFPSAPALRNPDGIQEERRLAYVGITRAMQQLFLSYASSRRLYGTVNQQQPSRFLVELPPQSLQSLSPGRTDFQAFMPQKLKKSFHAGYRHSSVQTQSTGGLTDSTGFSSSAMESTAGFRVGQRVVHPRFGVGKIIAQEGHPACRVQVAFETQGSKWLVTEYARLEILHSKEELNDA